MCNSIRWSAACASLIISAPAFAGPFSSGRGNVVAGAPDAAIPGFVGAAGDGFTAAPNVVNPLFKSWASGFTDYLPAPGVSPAWSDPSVLVGPVTGDNFDIVSLGDLTASQIAAGALPGRITVTFESGISNGAGPDFAVFENAFGTDTSVFAELAFVEVSSDGTNFARFEATSTNPSPGALGFVNPTNVHNLAGKHVNAYGQSWGTPFDLAELSADPLVTAGLLNLTNIRYIRLIDIPGSGDWLDNQGSPIRDSWPTTGSGGFDLHAIGVIHPAAQITATPGDANLDDRVDTLDFNILAAHFGLNGGAAWAHGDFDSDGQVTSVDFGILVAHFGQQPSSSAGGGASVPEPGMIVSVLLGLLAVRRTRR